MGLNKRLIGAGAAGGGFAPSENFKVVTYDGNGSTNNITGVGFQPDWVWIKQRDTAVENHNLYDSTRGVRNYIVTNSTAANVFGSAQRLNAFGADGFTVGSDNEINDSGSKYVAWCWKAGGGTTSSNTDGSITTTVQVNADAGFSIVTGTTPSSTANTNNAGHGLGVAPDLIIMKPLVVEDWYVYHSALGEGSLTRLNTTAAVQTGVDSIFSVVNSTTFRTNYTSAGNHPFVAYCFKAIDGFSKFGSYTGNGTTLIIETGFEPAFILIKGIVGNDNWRVYDTARGISAGGYLRADTTAVEDTGDAPNINILSNGFQITAGGTTVGNNANGNGYVYWAFAADPDTTAPTLADSFNVKTYTGDGGTQTLNGFGFKPNLVWLKCRNTAHSHFLADSVRGATKYIMPNESSAELTRTDQIQSFDTDGFTLGGNSDVNGNTKTYVAWSWKADDNESTIEEVTEDVDARAIYTLQSNANDVTGNYNATESGVTYSSGKFGNAAGFSGSDASTGSKIYVSNSVYGSSTSVFSISLWVKCTNTSGEIPLAGNGGTIGGTSGYAVYLENGKLSLTFRTNPNQDFYGNTKSINDNAWHHIVLTCNNGEFVLYLDNSVYVSGTSGNWTGNPTPTFDTYFGNRWNRAESGVLSGQIDQIRVYDKILTPASVTNLYNETTAQNSTLDIGTKTITSLQAIVSANANAGFSIVKYTGNGISGATVPHGLSAAPDMVIAKGISGGGSSWWVQHSSLAADKVLELNGSAAQATYSSVFNNTAATSTVVTLGSGDTNRSGETQILYCFHDVTGYSKFGTYSGNGSTGQTITTGFQPDFVIIKSKNNGSDWYMIDSARPNNKFLVANGGTTEYTASDTHTFVSTGFTLSGESYNNTGYDWIYMAFKMN